jgi:8-O-methyltransferase
VTTTDADIRRHVDPGPLVRLTIADCSAKVLQSAVRLELFTALADGPDTAAALAGRLGLHPRLLPDFLDALVGLGLLERDGDRYRNAALADAYLVQGRPEYLGGFVDLTNETLYRTWEGLTEALRTGQAQTLDPDKGGFVGDKHKDPEKMKRFLSGLDAFSNRMGAEIADVVDWSAHRSFVDLGGARGNLASVLIDRHPHLEAVCFDLPRTEPLFAEHVGRLGQTGRIRFVGGDFFADPIPAADVVVLGHILHGFDAERAGELLRRVYAAVRPGGAVVIYDRMIDNDRRDPERLLSSLHMRLVSTTGAEYRVADCHSWLRQSGFTGTTDQPLLGTHTLVIGRR